MRLYHHNYILCRRDYGVPTMNCVFDMVKVVDFALQEGKVRVAIVHVQVLCVIIYLLSRWQFIVMPAWVTRNLVNVFVGFGLLVCCVGRTGVVIACYLVYAYRMAPDDAILHVRSKR